MLHSAALPYTEDAYAYFAALADLPWAIWLDSGGRGRHDILVAQPVMTLVTRGGKTHITDDSGNSVAHAAAPLSLLRQYLGAKAQRSSEHCFAGGAVGYWSYDFARQLHELPEIARDGEHLPEMAVGIYDWALHIDHQAKKAELVSHFRFSQTEAVFAQVADRLRHCGDVTAPESFRTTGEIQTSVDRQEYNYLFDKIEYFINEGDCYQINLARRFAVKAEGNALAAYKVLRELSPAPYSAFLNLPFTQILSASPEQFLRLEDSRLTTRPIKGTRPVVADPQLNDEMVRSLRNSSKDRAENLMIVDLLRNDLGKHCEPGSVRVPHLFEVESFSTVHHLVSTVCGTLAQGADALNVLADCFPGGSITGAPKQRAMEIIEQLEPHRRGVYCGAIGYIGFDGNMDTNIAIRTLVYSAGEMRCWAGGGIVADSSPAAEFRETQDKAAAMLALMRHFGATGFERKDG